MIGRTDEVVFLLLLFFLDPGLFIKSVSPSQPQTPRPNDAMAITDTFTFKNDLR